MPLEPQATLEVAQFLANGPTPEQIIAFHPSPEATERVYALIAAEREGRITAEERDELEGAIHLEHMMRLIKAEARLVLNKRACY